MFAGAAKIDITPETPVRMYGYAIRTMESEGVAQRLKATALAIGGPVIKDRLWFFGGYQYQRDHGSQPGSDSPFPTVYDFSRTQRPWSGLNFTTPEM